MRSLLRCRISSAPQSAPQLRNPDSPEQRTGSRSEATSRTPGRARAPERRNLELIHSSLGLASFVSSIGAHDPAPCYRAALSIGRVYTARLTPGARYGGATTSCGGFQQEDAHTRRLP